MEMRYVSWMLISPSNNTVPLLQASFEKSKKGSNDFSSSVLRINGSEVLVTNQGDVVIELKIIDSGAKHHTNQSLLNILFKKSYRKTCSIKR